jgi:hypothetical protein
MFLICFLENHCKAMIMDHISEAGSVLGSVWNANITRTKTLHPLVFNKDVPKCITPICLCVSPNNFGKFWRIFFKSLINTTQLQVGPTLLFKRLEFQ